MADEDRTTAYSQARDMLQLLPHFVRKYRQERGVGTVVLAEELGLGKNTIARFERSGVANERVLIVLLNWLHEEELSERSVPAGRRRMARPHVPEPNRVGVLSRKVLGGVVTW